MSVYQTGQLLGILLVPIAAAMATEWGWRSAFFFLSIPAFIVAILARRLPEPVRGQQDQMQQPARARLSKPSRYDTMSGRQAYRELFRVRTFTLSPCRPESGRSSTGASARGHRRSSSATDMSVAQSAPRSASWRSVDSPECSSPGGWPTT